MIEDVVVVGADVVASGAPVVTTSVFPPVFPLMLPKIPFVKFSLFQLQLLLLVKLSVWLTFTSFQ